MRQYREGKEVREKSKRRGRGGSGRREEGER